MMLITVCVRALRHWGCTGGRAPGAQVQWREGDVTLRGHQGALMGSPPENPSPTMRATGCCVTVILIVKAMIS